MTKAATLSEYMLQRIRKKIVKLKLKHGSDYDEWPLSITTSINRPGNYHLKISFTRSRGWYTQRAPERYECEVVASAGPTHYGTNFNGSTFLARCRKRRKNYCGTLYLRDDTAFAAEGVNLSQRIEYMVNRCMTWAINEVGVPDIIIPRTHTEPMEAELLAGEITRIEARAKRQAESTLRDVEFYRTKQRRDAAYTAEYVEQQIRHLQKSLLEDMATTKLLIQERIDRIAELKGVQNEAA